MTERSILVLVVSGITYRIKRDILLKYPNTYLGRLASTTTTGEIWIDRPIACFEAVFAYYQTGELHIPTQICPKAFKTELEFWCISATELEQCCLFRYLQFMGDLNMKANFTKQHVSEEGTSTYLTKRQKLWKIVDNRDNSLGAKIFLVIGISFVLASIITISLSTLSFNRRHLTPCEIHAYYRDEFDKFIEEETEFLSVDCESIILHDGYFTIEGDDDNYTLPDSLPETTVKNDTFMTVEYITTTFFTIELLLRLISTPSWKQYFKSIINIADIISIISAFIAIGLIRYTKTHQHTKLKIALDHLQVLRLLRLVRYCQHFRTIQVLKYSLIHNFKDLLVLLLYLTIGIFMFANIVYLAEDKSAIRNIPDGWWLGIVTMTTTGYGDITPKTYIGKTACAICAVCGVLLISLLLPIFVESFMALYGVANLNMKENKKSLSNASTSSKVTMDKSKDLSSKVSTLWS